MMKRLLMVLALGIGSQVAIAEGLPGRPYRAATVADNPHSWYVGVLGGYHWAGLEEGRFSDGDQNVTVGAYAAYLYRLSKQVSVGGEVDVMWADLSVRQCRYEECQRAGQEWLASARGKVGWHVNEAIMAYGTGGAAWSDEQGVGAVAGGGLEAWLFANVTGRVEALHYFMDRDQTVIRAGLGVRF